MVRPNDDDELNERERSSRANQAVLVDHSALKREAEKAALAASMQEYLAGGGNITVCEPGARTEDIPGGQWSRRASKVKPPTPPK